MLQHNQSNTHLQMAEYSAFLKMKAHSALTGNYLTSYIFA